MSGPAAEVLWAPWPYRAGLCITGDTDAADLPSVRAVYDHLRTLGLRATKTVWPFRPTGPSPSASTGPSASAARAHCLLGATAVDRSTSARPCSGWTSGGRRVSPWTSKPAWEHPPPDERPFSVAPQRELVRLFAEHVGVIGRELALRRRSPDPDRFLGADEIPLEDHANR